MDCLIQKDLSQVASADREKSVRGPGGRREGSKGNVGKIEKSSSGKFISVSAKQQITFFLANDYITLMTKKEKLFI